MQSGFLQQVDVRTLLIASAVAALLMTACLGFGLRRHAARIGPAARLWVLGTALQLVGFVLLAQRGQWPEFFTSLVSNLLLLGGYLFYLSALRRFTGQGDCTALAWSLMALMALVVSLFTWVWPDYTARIVAASPIHAAVFGMTVHALLKGAPRPLTAGYTITIVAFAAGVVLLLERTLYEVLIGPPLSALLIATPLQVITLGYAGLLPVMASFGFLLICNDRSHAELERLAATDPLTGVLNRRMLEQLVNGQIADARRHTRPLSLLLLDADHFKTINDDHGHEAGDQALRALVAALRPHLRPNDLIGRLGGEEFLIALATTMQSEAVLVAERLRAAVLELPLMVEGKRLALSVSIGVATQAESEPDDFAALVRRADAAMYEAKHAGRNCVRAAPWGASAWHAPTAGISTSVH